MLFCYCYTVISTILDTSIVDNGKKGSTTKFCDHLRFIFKISSLY